jgi:hypothetical protein
MDTESTISFGDNVRVRATSLTQELGLAGMSGQVYGETTPSVTNVEVIGELREDYAINVFFDARKESLHRAQKSLGGNSGSGTVFLFSEAIHHRDWLFMILADSTFELLCEIPEGQV